MSRYAPELVEGGFAVEVADAPLLHDGLNVADVAHVLVLRERGVIPDEAARRCSACCATRWPPRGGVRLRPRARRGLQLPRAPVRRRDRPRRGLAARRTAAPRGRADRAAAAGAPRRGRPRRGGRRVRGCGRAGRRRAGRDPDGRPDLPAARPAVDVRALPVGQRATRCCARSTGSPRASTGSTAAPRARAGSTAARWSATAPAPRRCSASTASSSTPATPCGRATGSPRLVADAASLATTLDRLAEDLEIYASAEFGWVVLGDGHTRSSACSCRRSATRTRLTMVRGAAGVLIGRATGMSGAGQEPVRAQRQPDLRLRRGAPRPGAGHAGDAADGRGGQRTSPWTPSACARRSTAGSRRPPTSPST